MITVNLELGDGVTKTTDDKLTLNFGTEVPVTKTNGVYINASQVGSQGTSENMPGSIDNYTVKRDSAQPSFANNRPNIDGNPDVIVMVYTMTYKERTNYSSTSQNYNSSLTNNAKGILGIIDEFNCVMDNGTSSSGQLTSYILQKGDLIQFRTGTRPVDTIYGWSVAMDDSNRYEDDEICAMFLVTDVTYGTPSGLYINSLSIRCIWFDDTIQALADAYTIGGTYTGSGKRLRTT